ncbi:DNA-binding transcriptional regulator, MerR family [Streptomyces sp. 2131.1]|nr:DNA-binding transcriptional regulator, MerR family [Streptomyces sp. 2131.1]
MHSGPVHEDLISIGEFAARTRLSPKALRLYGERGLLPPARVDPRTGFRRNGLAQVEQARRIALLRATGMPLAGIAEVLVASGEEPVRLLAAHWRQQESVHAALREAVGYAREVLTGRNPAMYEILEREVPEQKVLFIQRHVTAADLPAFLADSTELLFSHLRTAGACLSGPLFAVYHGLWCRPIGPGRGISEGSLLRWRQWTRTGLSASFIHSMKSRASSLVARSHSIPSTHRKRHHRSRSMPYERSVSGE